MAVSIVNSTFAVQNNTGDSTKSVLLTGVQSGDAIVVFGNCEGSETITFSDDQANSYTEVANRLSTGGFPRGAMAVALNTANGNTRVQMALSATQYRFLAAVALRGVKTSGAVESTTSNEGSGVSATFSGSTAVTNGIVVAALGSAGANTLTESAGWTLLQENEDGNFSIGSLVYKLSTGGSTYASTWAIQASAPWVTMAVHLAEAVTSVAPNSCIPRIVGAVRRIA